MQRKPRNPEILDDDPMLFDAPPEWLVLDHAANDWRHPPDDEDGLRALASNVALLSRREWPRARLPRDRLRRPRERSGFRDSA